MSQIAKVVFIKIHKRSVYDEMVLATLRKWQYDILVILFKQNNRKVMWVYDEEGWEGRTVGCVMPQKELNSDRRVRRWCFTLNNPEFCVDYFKKFSEIKNVRRFIFGHERGSESDTVHLQGYMEFEVSVRFPVLKKISPRAHWEPSAGTPYQNYKYCSKEGNFQVFGNWNSEESRLKRERKHGARRRESFVDRYYSKIIQRFRRCYPIPWRLPV
ncbi:hypothetical protein Anas_14654 [Armadillidium nasatum]|uniref:CRESS-DNA virus Rep endonuclease domain-containing protein n=1 Tax=Armadillidium nasatum TaxID=96803 RepID=A0A5N5T1F9_9CRUS|nr:hypothetical protein Anas_14654 [Armadillidium nasatum]